MIYLRNHGLSNRNRRKGLLQMFTWIKSGTFRSLPHNGSLMSKAEKNSSIECIFWPCLNRFHQIHLSYSQIWFHQQGQENRMIYPSGNQNWPENPASIISRWFSLFGDGSIPINTIFRGMNIHLPAILMWTTGVQGFDTLPFLAPFSWSKTSVEFGDLATFHDAEHPGIAQLHAVSQHQSSQDPLGT